MPGFDLVCDPRFILGDFVFAWHRSPRGCVVTRSYWFIDKWAEKDAHEDVVAVFATPDEADRRVAELSGRQAAA